jgi:hypothetical protein
VCPEYKLAPSESIVLETYLQQYICLPCQCCRKECIGVSVRHLFEHCAIVRYFIFSTDNPCSTTLYFSDSPNSQPQPQSPDLEYIIESEYGKKLFTYIFLSIVQELAKLEWRGSTPDIVHFTGNVLQKKRINV